MTFKEPVDDLLLFLARTPVECVHPRSIRAAKGWKENGVLTLSFDERISKAFDKLIKEGFLSAPVLDNHRVYTGIISLLDIVSVHCTRKSHDHH
jgi:predicted transcriptional regulator